ncbi:hypothetical protein [Lactiplantibacillus songbeiensis]|uniref:Uncharacterized protein n=1 Tax=Lactiplantibacillus songbeiensis TaxID=2559920 RepID=A0ABW4C5K3_9LACO|nr:hypothetical protein [Lactiplantibacillus songbeiensis]
MSKEDILKFLGTKRALTADVQDARHARYVAETNYEQLRKQAKHRLIWAIVGIFILPIVVVAISPILSAVVFWGGIAGTIYLAYVQHGQKRQASDLIEQANQQINAAMAVPAYVQGMQDFPQKFYSYWTIDRLMHLISENRATTLQEAFNVAETQDFQNDQLSMQQENLAVAKSTNSAANISAVANVFTAFNTRK